MPKFSLPRVAAGVGAGRAKRSATSYIKQHVRDRLTSNFGIVGAYAADKVGLRDNHRGFYPQELRRAKRKNAKIKATEPAAAIEESAEQLGSGLSVIEHAINQGGEDVSKELARFSEDVSAKLDAISNELEAMAYQAKARGGGGNASGVPGEGGLAAKSGEKGGEGGGWWDFAKGILAGAFLGKLGKLAVLLARGTPIAAVLVSLATLAAQKRQFELDHPEEAQALRDRYRGGHLLDPAHSGTTEEVKKQGPLVRPKFLSVAEIGVELKKRGKSLSDLDPSKREGNVVFLKDGTRIDLGSQVASPSELKGPEAAAPTPEATPGEQTFEADRIEIEGAKEICFEEDVKNIQGDDSIPRGTTQGAANRNGQATNMRGIGNPQTGVKDPTRLHAGSGGWTSHAFTDNPSNVTKAGVTQLQGRVYMSDEPQAIAKGWTTERLENESTLGLMHKSEIFLRNSPKPESGMPDRRNPLVGQTFDHEATHLGAEDFFKKSPETKKMFPEVKKHEHFEELRERIHDKLNFQEALKKDPKNPALRNRMDQTDHFIKSISEQIAKTEGGKLPPQHFINRAAQYNDHLNQAIGEQPHFKKAPYGFDMVTGQPNPTPVPAKLVDRAEGEEKTDNPEGQSVRHWTKDDSKVYRSHAGERDPSKGFLQNRDATRELSITGDAGILGLLPPTTDEQRRIDAMEGSFASKNAYATPPRKPGFQPIGQFQPPAGPVGIGSDFARGSSTATQTQRQEEDREREREDQPSFTDMAGTGYQE